MANPAVPSIVLQGIDTVQLAHAAGEIALRRFNQKVLLIAHQAISMTQPVVLLADLAKRAKERRTIIVGRKELKVAGKSGVGQLPMRGRAKGKT